VLPVVLRRRVVLGTATLPRDSRNRLRLSGAVLFGGALAPVLLLRGLLIASSSSVSMWLSLEAVATACLAVALFREQLGPWTWAGNLGVVGGGVLLAFQEGPPGWTAVLFVAGAAVCWGVDNNLTALIDGITPAETTLWKGLIAGLTNVLLALLIAPPRMGTVWLAALGVGALSYGLSIVLYIGSAQSLGAARAQMLFATSPLFGVLLSMLLLDEHLGRLHVAAGLLIGVSLVLMLLERHEPLHEHPALEHVHAHRHDDGHHLHDHDGLPRCHRHTHRHAHAPLLHRHPHWPDRHHRHTHA